MAYLEEEHEALMSKLIDLAAILLSEKTLFVYEKDGLQQNVSKIVTEFRKDRLLTQKRVSVLKKLRNA